MRIARGSESSTRWLEIGPPISPISRYGPLVCDGVSATQPMTQSSCGSSSGVASRPPSTMSNRNPRAQSGCVSSSSNVETSR